MDRTFIPEVYVGFMQIDLTDNAVHTLGTEWAAQVAAQAPNFPDINKWQYLLMIDIEGANVRWRADAVAPTAAVGSRLIKDTQFIYTAATRSAVNFIQETAGAKLNISVYRHTV